MLFHGTHWLYIPFGYFGSYTLFYTDVRNKIRQLSCQLGEGDRQTEIEAVCVCVRFLNSHLSGEKETYTNNRRSLQLVWHTASVKN